MAKQDEDLAVDYEEMSDDEDLHWKRGSDEAAEEASRCHTAIESGHQE